MAQIEDMSERNQRDADDGQDGFLDTVRNRQRGTHESEAGHGNDKGCGHAVAQRAPTDRHARDQGCQQEPDLVNFGSQEKFAPDPQARHEHDRQQAMQSTGSGKKNSRPVKPPTNRQDGALQHGMAVMLCCIPFQGKPLGHRLFSSIATAGLALVRFALALRSRGNHRQSHV